MAEKVLVKKKGSVSSRGWLDLKPETKRAIWGVVTFGVALMIVLAFVGRGGLVGEWVTLLSRSLFGWGAFIVPAVLLAAGVVLLSRQKGRHVPLRVLLGALLFLSASLTLLAFAFTEERGGGSIGNALIVPTEYLFGFWAGTLLWVVLFMVSVFVLFNTSPFHRPPPEFEETALEAAKEGEKAPLPEGTPGPTLAEKVGRVLRPRFLFSKVEESAAKGEEKKAAAPAVVIPERGVVRATSARSPFPAYTPPPLKLLESGKVEPTPGDVELHTTMIKRTLENFGIAVEMAEVNVGPTVTQYTLKPAEGVKLSRIVALQSDLALALAAHPLRIEAPIPGRSLVGIEIPNKTAATVRLRGLLEQDAQILNIEKNLGRRGSGATEDEASRITDPLAFALGRDVTAAPVFASLAKMPHLLIAGSTGSGKSIGIHSFLMNLLYRYGPEELQLVLVDPKRVEMMMYNDIPQLLTSVIVEPKKTLAALRWALTEMDRRYQLLAQYGTRDIASFHARKERMPYVVIVIDELADMMAAFGREVEGAIVRLAQMARAVGIHLVVSTQRPSVEVITGLIKANITARVAFQVASQIDSRTILDMAGAEKLLGAGDMLFLRGDGSKPRRVQGAYVTEAEVKRVTDWLRASRRPTAELAAVQLDGNGASDGRSDDAGISEAGVWGGRRGSADDQEEDAEFVFGDERFAPPFGGPAVPAKSVARNGGGNGMGTALSQRPAPIFASESAGENEEPLYEEAKRAVIEARRASASLLQRRLRVGYARAARLIDLLEERGVIGPGDGAKAREILIAEEQAPGGYL
ncbi:MAG: DNA translocase FtsK 4TM domain-containing protein [bacterium]|nr:DNA translocase FtsK 4TM domain-containing protein [bacterium]MDZ4296344.1 DNA translocase FtsK 4TM domain-containing protein [Patescibacteria group bacterium]